MENNDPRKAVRVEVVDVQDQSQMICLFTSRHNEEKQWLEHTWHEYILSNEDAVELAVELLKNVGHSEAECW